MVIQGVSNELLFYGGSILAICSLIGLIIALIILKMRSRKLERIFDQEYGKKKQQKTKRKQSKS